MITVLRMSNSGKCGMHTSSGIPSESRVPATDRSSRIPCPTKLKRRQSIIVALLSIAVSVSGCATLPRVPYTENQQLTAEVPGMSNVRFWADASEAELLSSMPPLPVSPRTKHGIDYLALSGGGSAGAFGAGLLIAWTERGDRPEFDTVSGVSIGALTAPFAFLGPSEDDHLRRIFTSGIAEKLVKPRQVLAGLLGESLLRGEPLADLIATYVNADMISRIAAEHRKGRTLLVVTTNLDAQRAVVWNMTAIAASGAPGSLELFRDVLTASASIPGVYPAVPIKITSAGKTYTELHADGGTSTQVFIAPDSLALDRPKQTASRPPGPLNLYVVINNTLEPEFSLVRRTTGSVTSRAYSTIVKSHTVLTVNAAYALARRDSAKFHLAYLDETVPYSATDPFNKDYMLKVFAIGHAQGMSADWHRTPPTARGSSQQQVPVELAHQL